jgi:DNA invertase Pin-like site-specific DNA recombinase
MLIGYARVSTQDQGTQAQIDALRLAGCQRIYEEKRSGGSLSRPILFYMLDRLRPGDVVIVYKLDRIARSLTDLLQIIERIKRNHAQFRSLTEVIDTETAAGRLMLMMLGAFAEFELELIRERTRAGLAAAAARGSKIGRPRSMTPEQEAECVRCWTSGIETQSALAKRMGVDVASIKRAIARAREAAQPELFG